MNDGSVTIVVDADESEAKKKLENVEDAANDAADDVEELGDSAKKTKKELDDLGDKGDKAGKKFKLLGKEVDLSGFAMDALNHATGNLLSGGIEGLISGIGDAISSLVSLAEETREFRDDMAKLETAFKDAGHTTEAAEKAYEDFYAILGESDRSVEAVNHLAELTDNTEDLTKWSTIAAGVTAKFGDSLPIEGLTEAANETAKVGAVTGPLADALNWAGISEDKFNEQLKKCNSEQARATLITNTLNKEYSAAAAEYNALTAETQNARRATAEMEQAQARLGAAFEPVALIATEAKTAFFNFAATLAENVAVSIDKAKTAATGLNAEQRALVNNALEAAEALRVMREASAENAGAINSQFDYTQKLADELFTLADENGRVTDAEKGRVEFILGELSTALGEEYRLIGNQIQQYNGLRDSINETIAAERARLLLAEYQDDYVAALQASAEQQAAIEAEREAMYQTYNELEEARSKEKILRLEYEQAKEDGASAHYLQRIGSELTAYEKNTRNKELLYEKQKKKLGELEEKHAESGKNIAMYEDAKTAILEGNTEKAIKLINDYDKELKGSTDNTKTENEKQKEAARARVIDTSVQLGILEEEYKEKEESMTDTQKAEMQKRIDAAKKQAQDARREYKNVGGDMVEGLVEGAKDKDGQSQWNLGGALWKIVKDGIAKAREAADSHSPSRETIKLGEDLDEGLVIGVVKNRNDAIEAMRYLGNDLVKEAAKAAEKEVKVIEDKIEHLDEIRTTANAKQIDAQKKTLKKELEVKKERAKVMADYAKEYETHLSEMEKLTEDYQKEHLRLEEQLYQDIEKVQSDYWSTFENRKNAIRDSLGLFDIAEKGEAVSGKDLTKALTSQVNLLEQYDNALATLAGRNANASFIEEISQLGVDYLPQLEAINKMTDEELAKYVELWQEKNALAGEAATKALAGERERAEKEIEQLRTTAKMEAETLAQEYNDAMFTLLEEVSTGMLKAGNAGIESLGKTIKGYVNIGKEMVNGIIEGIASRGSALSKQMQSTVNDAIAATKDEAEIHSPSDVTSDELGAPLALGVGEGWADEFANLKNTMALDVAGLIERLRATVSAENAYYGRSAGTPDNGFTDLARAVGIQTAGINSLANEYRGGAGRMRPIVIELNGRELGRAVVDVGNAEAVRVGTKLVTGGV